MNSIARYIRQLSGNGYFRIFYSLIVGFAGVLELIEFELHDLGGNEVGAAHGLLLIAAIHLLDGLADLMEGVTSSAEA